MNKHTRYLLEMTQVKEKIKRIPIPITRRKSVDSADCILNQNKIKHVNALKIHAASPLVGKYSRVVGGKNCPNNLTYFRNFVICLHVLRFLIIIFLLFFARIQAGKHQQKIIYIFLLKITIKNIIPVIFPKLSFILI